MATGGGALTTLCRDCGALATAMPFGERCGACGSPRLIAHRELGTLSIAHVDCDAFYATVEKRGRPELADRPVIIGGGARGVVLACCYVARLYGVRSAMPMFKALAACPDAVVIRPDMAKYREVGREVARRDAATYTVDRAIVDRRSVSRPRRHANASQRVPRPAPYRASPSGWKRCSTSRLSIGLSDKQFLAKIASDLDKPRGFAILSRSEAAAFLADKPVSLLWGVGQRCSGDLPATELP